MKYKNDILYRLALEIDSRYATRKEFVDAVNNAKVGKDKGISEQQVSNILSGRNGFGNKMKRRFAAIGIDIDYIDTGIRAQNEKQDSDKKSPCYGAFFGLPDGFVFRAVIFSTADG